MGGPTPQNPKLRFRQIWGNFEAKWAPMDAPRRVSTAAVSFSPRSWFWEQNLQKTFPKPGLLPNSGMGGFLLSPQITCIFVNFRTTDLNTQQSRRLRDRFQQVRLAELVWKLRVSDQNLDSEINVFKKGSPNLVICPTMAFRNSCFCFDSSKTVP